MEPEELESDLRRAQQRLHRVITSNPAVLFTLKASEEQIQGLSWISENVQEIFGYPAADALGSRWWAARIHPDDRDAVLQETCVSLFAQGQIAHEFRFQCADGEYRWTKCRIRLVRDQAGRSVEAVGVWLDVQDRKHAEEEEAKLRDQFEQAQRLESLARLAGGAAHDFNNLLTVINGYADMLLAQLPPDDPLRESASEIRMAGDRAAQLSRQLLILSRKQVVQPVAIDLNEIIAELRGMLVRVVGEDVEMKILPADDLAAALADPGQMRQVLVNLVVNARDAMPSGGTLFIETDNAEVTADYAAQHVDLSPGPYVRLKVGDTGIGMAADVLAHVFEPFFTTKAIGEGAGLGLATVYGIVRQAGGAITVYSEPGHGSLFTIYLPRVKRGVAAAVELAGPAELPTVRGTETILLVDDHEQVRRMAARVLRECGYKVLEARDGEEALRLSDSFRGAIDLLLTDVVMPGMTGRELADRVRAARGATGVVFISAYSETAIHQRGVVASSIEFLQKPFSPAALASKVREALGPPRTAGTVLVIDDESGVRNFLRKILTGAGYEVVEAEHGGEALHQIERASVDLVICDLVMPEKEGFETVQAIRREYPQIRIIAMSGQFADLLRVAELLGADAAIEKPMGADDLLSLARRVMTARPRRGRRESE